MSLSQGQLEVQEVERGRWWLVGDSQYEQEGEGYIGGVEPHFLCH